MELPLLLPERVTVHSIGIFFLENIHISVLSKSQIDQIN